MKRWCKTIRGTRHYFGDLDDWKGALERYQATRDDLQAGRTPRPAPGEGVSVEAKAPPKVNPPQYVTH